MSSGIYNMRSEKIRILHVFGVLDKGGAETMIMEHYRRINRSIFQFDFVVHGEVEGYYSKELREMGATIYRVPKYNGKNHRDYIKSWEKLLQNHNFDIIHGHVRSTASIYLKIAKKNNVKCIAHSHSTASRGNLVSRVIKDIMQLPIRSLADFYLASSYDAGKWLFGKRITQSSKFKIFKNAIDIAKFQFNESIRDQLRTYHDIENDDLIIGHVGNFDILKNHSLLIKIIKKLRITQSRIKLVLIGQGDLSTINGYSLELQSNIIHLGGIDNVNEYLNMFDIFLFPSLKEGLGISLVEAQANGLPCLVSTNIPSEALILETTKVLSNETSVWVNAILEQPLGRISYKNSYKSLVKAGYDINENVKLLESIYNLVLGS